VYQSLGKIYQQRKDWLKAIDEFNKAIELNPRDVDSYFQLSQSYYSLGMMNEAAQAAQATLSLRPNHLRSLLFLALYFKSKKDIKESLVYLEKAQQMYPLNRQVRLEYADTLVTAEDYERAIQIYQQLLAEMPENPQVYNKLGLVYFYLDDYPKAIEYLEQEVSLQESADSYFLLGAAYGKLERYPEAVNHLKKYMIYAPAQDPRRQRAEGALKYYESQIK